MTMTDPNASARTCKNTALIFILALLALKCFLILDSSLFKRKKKS